MSKERDDFIAKYSQAVINAVKGTGVLPSITMAQMIIESSGKDENGVFKTGGGVAARKANNFFGIKADKNYKGPKLALSTPRDASKVNYFRIYSNPQDSIKDHTDFFLKNSRYKTVGLFKATTPEEQAAALDRSHYSESPTYGKALLALIDAYHLRDLDGKPVKATGNSVLKDIAIGAGFLAAAAGIYELAYPGDLKKRFQHLF